MTTQINKSQIFKSAWSLVKTTAITLSQALKQAWAEAKALLNAPAFAPTHTIMVGGAYGKKVELAFDASTLTCTFADGSTAVATKKFRGRQANAPVYFTVSVAGSAFPCELSEIAPAQPKPRTLVDKVLFYDDNEDCYGHILHYSDESEETILSY